MTLQWHRMTERERDAAVCIHVLQWRADRDFPSYVFWDEVREPHNIGVTFKPTTLPEACALVIEAMRARGFSILLTVGPKSRWACSMTSRGFYPDRLETFADTMSECVALCALRAVGVTVETEDKV